MIELQDQGICDTAVLARSLSEPLEHQQRVTFIGRAPPRCNRATDCCTAFEMRHSFERGATLMAIRTQHFTLRYLDLDSSRRCATSDEVGDIRRLDPRVKVIELEHQNVALATLRAGVAGQELVYQIGSGSLQARLLRLFRSNYAVRLAR